MDKQRLKVLQIILVSISIFSLIIKNSFFFYLIITNTIKTILQILNRWITNIINIKGILQILNDGNFIFKN